MIGVPRGQRSVFIIATTLPSTFSHHHAFRHLCQLSYQSCHPCQLSVTVLVTWREDMAAVDWDLHKRHGIGRRVGNKKMQRK